MALDQEFYMLQNTTIVLKNGARADVTNVTIKRNPVYVSRRVGEVDQQVFSHENKPDIMVEGFNTSDFHFADMIPNEPIEEFELTSDNDADASLLQSDFFTKFPVDQMVFGAVETGFDLENPSKWRCPIECNVLNPNA